MQQDTVSSLWIRYITVAKRQSNPAGVHPWRERGGGEVKKTARQEFDDCKKGIVDSINRWEYININGCSDPGWPDGCNMNLVRNHIFYYKKKILDLCGEEGFAIPEEYYLPTPPEVANGFMADMGQESRVKRLKQYGIALTEKKTEFDVTQLSLF